MHAVFHLKDQIDENLKTALQLDLLGMAPGLRVQVRCQLLIYFTVHFEIPLMSKIHMYVLWIVINNYSTSVRWIWDGELAIIISNPTSASGIIVLLKCPQNIETCFFQTLFVKTINLLSACFWIWADAHSYHICRGWYDGFYYSGTPLMRPLLGHKILVVIMRWSH